MAKRRRFTADFKAEVVKEIVFAGSTVYVATDRGILGSQTGAHWRVITDDVVIDRLAVNGLTVMVLVIGVSIAWIFITRGNRCLRDVSYPARGRELRPVS